MLVAQTGRKRQTERKGILTETYPSVFVVDLDPDEKHYITFFKKFQVYHTRSLFATTFARQTGCFVEFLFIF